MDVSDTAHRQPREIADLYALSPSDRQGQRSDRRRLIDDEQHPPKSFQGRDQLDQRRLVLRQRGVGASDILPEATIIASGSVSANPGKLTSQRERFGNVVTSGDGRLKI